MWVSISVGVDFQHDSSVSVRKEKNTLIFHGFRAYILVFFLKIKILVFKKIKTINKKIWEKKDKGKFSSID